MTPDTQLDLFTAPPSAASFECRVWDEFMETPNVEVPPTTLSDPNRKWRVVSAYQKAIRRSDTVTAVKCAVALYRSDPNYFLRRNSVVMFEDLGPANIFLCALSLIFYKRRKTLQAYADQLVANMAYLAASSNKDRALCWTAVSSWFPKDSKPTRDSLALLNLSDPLQLIAELVDPTTPLVHRYQCLMGLYGKLSHRLDGAELPKQQPRKAMCLSAVQDLGVPEEVYYCVEQGAALGLEGLPFALPFLYEASKSGVLTPMDIPAPETICGLPSYAFDKHVLEGRRALSRMTYRTGVKSWVEDNGFKPGSYEVMGVLAFEYEGGNILDKWLAYPESKDLLVTARRAHLESAGVTLELAESSGKDMFLAALPKLNECRSSEANK